MSESESETNTNSNEDTLPSTESEWREILTDEQYEILRERGTEPRFGGPDIEPDDDGQYRCAGCDAPLFNSETKFDSGTGWPSFFDANEKGVETKVDTRHGMERIEVVCRRCGGHLGHVFEDGPEPTGQRYCINAVALDSDSDADADADPDRGR
ncbi:peptide-methionine (R)-S-oxide reductase MsrB [Haloquadratum walsbyi]|jgi:peptide-methionine (R)-S-oxide reductase|uniref:peptide-methionine (R)-S-oxide reductase n=1 Tax=Haloquadratum walsbyi (strain DSM 16790 / HBSQ001) TaxID=362976 RepID=Q18G75_HALWD|nr:peptide-methionine (R)-S-oxide reductase MsrB [Haloquadratum walsbyi]CAJ53026.1 peptide methionine sulfoxide reductase MsrB (R-form specific) [Haloquadratum walsbyi DSM 16790]